MFRVASVHAPMVDPFIEHILSRSSTSRMCNGLLLLNMQLKCRNTINANKSHIDVALKNNIITQQNNCF